MKIYVLWSNEYKCSGPICYFLDKGKARAWKEEYDRKSAQTTYYGAETEPLGKYYISDIEVREVETQD